MFPEQVFRLSARDLSGNLCDIVRRSTFFTFDTNVDSSGTVYTCPQDKLFVLTSMAIVHSIVSTEIIRGAYAAVLNASGQTVGLFGFLPGMWATTSNTLLTFSWTGEAILLPGDQLSFAIAGTAVGAVACNVGFNGYQIPLGGVGTLSA